MYHTPPAPPSHLVLQDKQHHSHRLRTRDGAPPEGCTREAFRVTIAPRSSLGNWIALARHMFFHVCDSCFMPASQDPALCTGGSEPRPPAMHVTTWGPSGCSQPPDSAVCLQENLSGDHHAEALHTAGVRSGTICDAGR